MPRQRDWSGLAAGTQHRYEQAGISRSEYESGASLRSARGHAATPEHPGTGANRPEFESYYTLRRDIRELTKEVHRNDNGFRGSDSKINKMLAGKSRAHLEKAREALQDMADNEMSLEDLRMMYPGEYDGSEWDWLGWYHM